MQLTVKERLTLLQVLANYRGNIADLRIVRDLTAALAFSEAEQADLGISQQENGQIAWKRNGEPVDITIGPRATAIIWEAFARLDQTKALTMEHLPVYERFEQGESKLKEVKRG